MAGQGRPSRQSAPEQAERQAWRVLVMVLKAKLEAVEAGITTITGFLGDTDYSPQQELTEDILPSCTPSVADCTDSAATEARSRRIRVYPTAAQRLTLKLWF